MTEADPSSAAAPGFGMRLASTFSDLGRLCVGIDPHAYLLGRWGLRDSAGGAREFGLRVVDAAHGRIGIVKPQVAFFERFGADGYRALESVLAAARAAGLLVIADVKRGDIGSSLEAYGQAWLTPGSPLEADAMTVSAYQGVGSLSSAIALAQRHGKGLFVLAATSNPEARAGQLAEIARGGVSVAAGIVNEVIEVNRAHPGPYGALGVVLGATIDPAAYGIPLDALAAAPATPILVPGLGYQGGRFDALPARFGPAIGGALVSVSRSILEAGQNGLVPAIDQHARELAACLE